MIPHSNTIRVGVVAFLVGLAIPLLVIWNPGRWTWAERVTGRMTASSVHPRGPSTTTPDTVAPAGRRIKYWQAPMDPTYVSTEPGKSPMGMDLIPVYEDETEAMIDRGVRVPSSFVQNFAVRTAVVEEGSIPVSIRTVGIVAHNEERVVSVNTKFRAPDMG